MTHQSELLEVVDRLGYGPDRRREDFAVWMGAGATFRVGVAAFTVDTPHDMTTSALVGSVAGDNQHLQQILAAARTVAAPAAIVSVDSALELWTIGSSVGTDRRLHSFRSDELSRLVELYRERLAPEAIAAAKSSAMRQLEMFPVDIRLLASAQRSSSKKLLRLVTDGLEVALEAMPVGLVDEDLRMREASRMVVGALAALMVRDKVQNLPGTTPMTAVLEAAGKQFPRYFGWLQDRAQTDLDAFTTVMKALGTEVNYQALDPSIVSEVYEEAVVSKQTRKDQGIYYTPPALARQILAHIPFEEIEPEARHTYDLACGAGNLLVAAYNRLDGLMPANSSAASKHRDLTRLIMGRDIDPFAVQLAGLSLLVNALPRGDRWRVTAADSLSSRPETEPTVIVSNPPWDDERPVGLPRVQRADRFVLRAIELLRDGGYLALVLPASWLSSEASRAARDALRSRCEVFEVLRLPEGTFTSSASAPCVIMARKGAGFRGPCLYRRMMGRQPGHAGRWRYTGEQMLVPQASLAQALTVGPLEPAMTQLASLRRLDDVADATSGPVPNPPAFSLGGKGEFLWLRYAKDLPAYGQPSPDHLIAVRFPADFHRAGTNAGDQFRQDKLLVSAKSNVDNPWRLKVGYAGPMVIPRESLHLVVPHDPADLPALLTILGSSVASAWVDTHGTKTAYGASLLQSLPVAGDSHWKELTAIGREIMAAPRDSTVLGELLTGAEQAVWDAYELSEPVRSALRRHFAGRPSPEGWTRFQPEQGSVEVESNEQLDTYGAVLAVGESRLTLWVSGVTEHSGVEIELPESIPGWLCYAGSPFMTTVRGGDLGRAEYRFQPHAYRLTPKGFEWPDSVSTRGA